MTSCYIYYKVDATKHREALAAANAILAAVRARCGLEGRLLRRSDDPNTWMEVYEHVPDLAALDAAIASAADGFEAVLVRGTKRIVERFEPCV